MMFHIRYIGRKEVKNIFKYCFKSYIKLHEHFEKKQKNPVKNCEAKSELISQFDNNPYADPNHNYNILSSVITDP